MRYQHILDVALWRPPPVSSAPPPAADAAFDLCAVDRDRVLRLRLSRAFATDCGAKRSSAFRMQLQQLVAQRATAQAAGLGPTATTAHDALSLQQLQSLPRAFGSKRHGRARWHAVEAVAAALWWVPNSIPPNLTTISPSKQAGRRVQRLAADGGL